MSDMQLQNSGLLSQQDAILRSHAEIEKVLKEEIGCLRLELELAQKRNLKKANVIKPVQPRMSTAIVEKLGLSPTKV
jgi:hypothetical protein